MASMFLERNEVRLSIAGAISAGTAVNGAVLDLAGIDGAAFFATIATANVGNFLKLQAGDLADGSDMADVAGSRVVADANGSVVGVEVSKLRFRYCRPVIVRAGANTVTGDIYAVRINSYIQPTIANVTNTHKTIVLQSPALGTA